ncbi:hypothetical protein D3C84_898200 [compost metagenome]
MLGLRHIHAELPDRRMRGELRAEHLHELRRRIRSVDQPVVEETQHRVGAVQGIPAAALLQPLAQRYLLLGSGDHFAGVADQE